MTYMRILKILFTFLLFIGMIQNQPLIAGKVVLKNGKVILFSGAYEQKNGFIIFRTDNGKLLQLPEKIVNLDLCENGDHSVAVEAKKKEKKPSVISSVPVGQVLTPSALTDEEKQKVWDNIHKHTNVSKVDKSASESVVIDSNIVDQKTYGGIDSERHILYQVHVYESIKNRNAKKLKTLLQMGDNVDSIYYEEIFTPLMYAIHKRWPVGVKMLLDKGASPIRKVNGYSPIAIALTLRATPEKDSIIKLLAKENAILEISSPLLENYYSRLPYREDPLGSTAIDYAIQRKNYDLIETIMEHSYDINFSGPSGERPIFQALKTADLKALSILARFGGLETKDLRTEKSFRELLVAKGNADLYQQVSPLFEQHNAGYGSTAADAFSAIKYHHLDIFKSIVEQEQLIEGMLDRYLVSAVEENSFQILDFLLNKNLNPNHQDKAGNPLLIIASSKGHLESVQVLLERGADPNLKGKDGLSALTLASGEKKLKIMETLREHL